MALCIVIIILSPPYLLILGYHTGRLCLCQVIFSLFCSYFVFHDYCMLITAGIIIRNDNPLFEQKYSMAQERHDQQHGHKRRTLQDYGNTLR